MRSASPEFLDRPWLRRHTRRLKRHLPLLGWIVFASLIPPAVFLGIVYVEDVRLAKRSLRNSTELGANRVNTVLNTGSNLLEDVAQNIDVNDPEAQAKLVRLVYNDPIFREIGIINEQGFLVLSNLGKFDPPVWVDPERHASTQPGEVEIVGSVKTVVMQEESIVIRLPTEGLGEVNALVDPAILIEPWGCIFPEQYLGTGFFAYINTATGEILASRGNVPSLYTLQQKAPAGQLRASQMSQNGEVLIIGGVPKHSVLQSWRRMLLLGAPISAICSGLLIFLSIKIVGRSEGLDRELVTGFNNHELVIHYQPIIHLQTGACVGSEALLRWYHPEQGILSPILFIPIAEKTGLINKIGEWALKQISQEQASLYEQLPGLYTSINVSPNQVSSGGLERILACLQDTNFCSPNRFVFEVTETTSVMGQGTTTADILARLRSTGARIALDDFGQGYSGLSYLHQLDVDVLKIDRLYVSAINKDPQLTSILESIIELGNKLGFTLVAEGIETQEQLQFLLDHQVGYGQGWLFSRPIPILEFEQFMVTRRLTSEE